jgi:hypothetical protein
VEVQNSLVNNIISSLVIKVTLTVCRTNNGAWRETATLSLFKNRKRPQYL